MASKRKTKISGEQPVEEQLVTLVDLEPEMEVEPPAAITRRGSGYTLRQFVRGGTIGFSMDVWASEYLENLCHGMTGVFAECVQKVMERGVVNNYGDALHPTGGILNQFALVERKQDRLRNQVWNRLLSTGLGQGSIDLPNTLDTLDDEINYLLFLRLMLEETYGSK